MSSTRSSWGATGSSGSPRNIAPTTPQTISLAADGTLPAGVTLAGDAITIASAGRVVADGELHIEAWNTASDAATNGNNSRSRVMCWLERAASGSTAFSRVRGSRTTASYIRIAKPYWNHGVGETFEHLHSEFNVSAGDSLRVRCGAMYRQAATVQHAVLAGSTLELEIK